MVIKLRNSKYKTRTTDIDVFKVHNLSNKQLRKFIYIFNSSRSIPIVKSVLAPKMCIMSKFAIKVHCAAGCNILVYQYY
jgi:hypothetical protein